MWYHVPVELGQQHVSVQLSVTKSEMTVIWGAPCGEAFQLATSQSRFVKYCLAKKFINVKLPVLTPKMWKKYLIIPIFLIISPVIGGKRKQNGERFYDSFQYLSFTTSSLGMANFVLMLKFVVHRLYWLRPKNKRGGFSILHEILFVWQWLQVKPEMFMWWGLWIELRQKQ